MLSDGGREKKLINLISSVCWEIIMAEEKVQPMISQSSNWKLQSPPKTAETKKILILV